VKGTGGLSKRFGPKDNETEENQRDCCRRGLFKKEVQKGGTARNERTLQKRCLARQKQEVARNRPVHPKVRQGVEKGRECLSWLLGQLGKKGCHEGARKRKGETGGGGVFRSNEGRQMSHESRSHLRTKQ